MSRSIKIESKIEKINDVEKFVKKISHENGFSKAQYIKIVLSITEAINNAIKHGNNGNENKYVVVHFKNLSDSYAFTVKDEGQGFDIKKVENPTEQKNIKKESGRGLFIIKNYADNVSFYNNGTIIKLIFKK
ncbi:MAG: ATP-binding protein [Prolixibacteraceae bacterium]|nr:ATP-binding protein [Prolixibacteraceae bacterium]